MVDKRILTTIGALLVIAVIVIAIIAMRPSLNGGGESFSELFDKLNEGNETVETLVLGSDFSVNQEIVIEDEIVAMRTSSQSTTFYFLYTGQKWLDEEDGTNFDVPMDHGIIDVRNAFFDISVSGKFSGSFDVGDMVTLKTSVVSEDTLLVFDHNWEVLVG